MSAESKRFDSEKYLEVYHEKGEFPRIHDEIARVVAQYGKGFDKCVDLGACVGLLSVRLAEQCGMSLVLGVEGNSNYLSRALKHEKVIYAPQYVTDETLEALSGLIRSLDIKLVVARRVFPEIGRDVVLKLAKALHDSGVSMVILEGRKPVQNPSNALYDADREGEALRAYYKTVYAKRACRVMVAR